VVEPASTAQVDPITLGSVGDDSRSTARDLVSWAGVCPRQQPLRRPRAVLGHHPRRSLPEGPARDRRPCYLKSYYNRLRTRRGPLRAQVAVQHKILTAIWQMLTHDVAYRDHARRLIAELIEQGYDVSRLIPENSA
jgi:hypothetical protein